MANAGATGSYIYMDANATTPLLPEVLEAMHPYWMQTFGNASSVHMPGQAARQAVDHARQVIAELKKVVTPSREETIRYIWIVLGFVLVMMLIVGVLDFVLGYLADKVFGG